MKNEINTYGTGNQVDQQRKEQTNFVKEAMLKDYVVEYFHIYITFTIKK